MLRRPKGGAGMARRARPPRWHLFGTVVVLAAALGLSVYLQWPHRTREATPVVLAPAPAAPAPPAAPGALADSLFLRADAVLAELGVWPELIRKARAAERGPSGGMVDRIAVRVPGDLPLTELNLYLTRTVQSLGGQVTGAMERQSGRQVELRCGLEAVETTVFVLDSDRQLTRRTGDIALVLQDVGGRSAAPAVERICRLPQGLVVALRADDETEASRQTEEIRSAGHHPFLQAPVTAGQTADPDAIASGMDAQTIRRLLRQAIRRVPAVEGLAWPPGSWPSSCAPVVELLLEESRRQGLPVLEHGMPSAATAGADRSARLYAADLVLDAVDDEAAVAKKLWELATLAAGQGQAIGVGRSREATLAALEAVLPRLETRGFRFVSLARLSR